METHRDSTRLNETQRDSTRFTETHGDPAVLLGAARRPSWAAGEELRLPVRKCHRETPGPLATPGKQMAHPQSYFRLEEDNCPPPPPHPK
ncbi:hypothetical protein EYF80_061911 [Liparis tanakae]|uniref:Uncharacterized protein n=1 Tax=Liparis tanakae TaxID=230148 RepID=A0A4Z2EGZ8_9TELE|nr:hypothetical protein EYF80_061911 [Liparis tanakae]